MKGWAGGFWRLLPAVRPAERSRALFFTTLLALISAAQTLGLAGSEALLLARLGAARLPEMFIAASLFTVMGSLLYAARVGHARNDRLLIQMLTASALLLAVAAVAASAGSVVVLPILFCFFYLSQSVFVNHFWTFSGDYFDSLASKRLFPVFVVGASGGGFAGGAGAAALTRAAGAVSLVWGWGGLLLAAALLLRLARRPLRRWGPLELEEADETSVEGMRGAARHLRASPLGRWMVLSALGMVLALFVAQYLYSAIFVQTYPDPTDLAAFFGVYLAVTNLIEIALELALTPWLIRRFGVPSANLVHPAIMLAGFGGLLLRYGLAAGIGARMARELAENAIAQPIRSLTYNALPQRLWGRIRAFLEGVVVYAGMSAAGALLLLLGQPEPHRLAAAGAAAATLYLVANLRVRREYLRELIDGIRAGRLDFGALADEIGDLEVAQLARLCQQLLREETERPSRSLLRLLPTVARRGIAEPLREGARHPHPSVRAACVRELASAGSDADDGALLRQALADPEPGVRLAALHALQDRDDSAIAAAIFPLLRDPDPRVRAVAAARSGDAGLAVLREMLGATDPATATAALHIAPPELSREVLARAFDPEPSVRAAALDRALVLSPQLPLPEETLSRALGAEAPAVRRAAVALAAARAADLADVAAALGDPAVEVRRAAVEALVARGEAGVQAALPYLREGGEATARAALDVVARAASAPRRLSLLRAELRFHVQRMGYWRSVHEGLPADDRVAASFLRVALEDATLVHRRLAFHVLSLLEDPRVVRKVDRALRATAQRTRADALEVLSNLGDRVSAHRLVLLHETAPLADGRGQAVPAARTPVDLPGTLREAARSENRWLRASAAAFEPSLRHNGPGLDVMERLLALKKVPLFANLTLDQLEAIHQLAREVSFVEGEVVMREGQPGNQLYILLEGRLEVFLGWGTPEASRLGEIRAVDYVGEMAILDDAPRSATIVTVEPSHLLALDGESLKDLILQMPEIAFEIFRVLTRRVRTAERRLQQQR